MRYSGLNKGSDCLFPDRVPGFCESGVHANKKYRFNRLFLEKNGFNQYLSLQFNGAFGGHFFDIYFRCFFGRFGLQMPLVARYCDHVGEFWVLKGFGRSGRFCFVGGCVSGFFKNISQDRKNFFSVFVLPIKISREFFWRK